MSTTKSLIDVMKAHYRGDIKHVSLESVKDASSFWKDFTNSVWAVLPTDDLIDCIVRDQLKAFKDVDTLEIVNKKGRLLKRFARFYKDNTGKVLTDSQMGIIGDKLQFFISQDGSKDYYVDFTNVIDWDDGQFGKDDSCWWGCYDESKDIFTDNGGWGVRFYRDIEDEQGIGRTWILPRNGMLLCFNAYGVQRANVSKVLKSLFAEHGIILHYKRIGLYNSCNSEIPYINGDDSSGSSGSFVMYPEPMQESDIQEKYDLNMEVETQEHCRNCGDALGEYDTNRINDYCYCDDCTNSLFSSCDNCNEYCDIDDVHATDDDQYLCRWCAERKGYELCEDCGKYSQETITTEDTDDTYCVKCNPTMQCEECEEYYDNMERHNERVHPIIDESGLDKNYETVHAIIKDTGNYHTSWVYRVPDVDGVYLWMPEDAGHTYSIVHDMSGLTVRSNIKTFAEGKQLLLTIAPLTDWMQSESELTSNKELLTQINNAIREITTG
jgi:hypothetical protein